MSGGPDVEVTATHPLPAFYHAVELAPTVHQAVQLEEILFGEVGGCAFGHGCLLLHVFLNSLG